MKAPRNYSFSLALKQFALIILILSNSAQYTAAQSINVKTALEFDGINDSVVIPRNEAFNFDTSDNFTIEVWLKYSGSAGTGLAEPDIIEFWQNLGGPYPFVLRGVSHTNAGQLVFNRYDGTNAVTVTSTRSDLNDGTWHHIALVHDGTAKSMAIYIDGLLDNSTTYTSLGSTKTSTNDLYLASRGLTGNNYGGQMDDVRIWNVVRTEEQIRNTRYALLTGAESGLVGYWPFNEGMGTTATDLTGGSNGTLTNMDSLSSWVPANILGNAVATTNLEQGVSLNWTISDSLVNSSTVFKIARNGTEIAATAASDRTFTDVNTAINTPYTYCISIDQGSSILSPFACATGTRVFNGPTNFTASDDANESYVQLSWNDNSEIEDGYRITRAPNDSTILLSANTSNFRDRTARPGTSYTYTIHASSGAINSASATDTGTRARIAAPANVTATDGIYTDRVHITWTEQTTQSSTYNIYRAEGNGAATLIGTTATNATSYSDMTAQPGVVYDYAVASTIGSNESLRVSDTGQAGNLAAPDNVTTTDGTFDDRIEVAWDYSGPAGITEFQILRDNNQIGTSTPGTLTFSDITAVPGTQHAYCVQAMAQPTDAIGPSMSSCTNAASPGRRALVLAPINATATAGDFEDKVDLAWESTGQSVMLFKVYRAPASATPRTTTTGMSLISSLSFNQRLFSDRLIASDVNNDYCVTAVTVPATTSAPAIAAMQQETARYLSRNTKTSEQNKSKFKSGVTQIHGAEGLSTNDLALGAERLIESQIAGTLTESAPTCAQGFRSLKPPTNVAATFDEHETHVEVTWTDNSDVERGHRIYRKGNHVHQGGALVPNRGGSLNAAFNFHETNAFTIEAWVRKATNSSNEILVIASQRGQESIGHSFEFRIFPSGLLNIEMDNGTQTARLASTTPVPINRWVHTAATYENGTFRIFIDGVLNNEGPALPSAQRSDAGLTINPVTGHVQELRLWNRARTSQEIAADKNQALSGLENGLSLYYPLNEGHGNVIFDVTNSKIDGVALGGASWVPLSGVSLLAGEVSGGRTSFADLTGQPGQTYTYQAVAFDRYATSPSNLFSESKTGVYAVSTDTTGRRTLLPPTQVQATDGTSEDQVELTWIDNSRGETDYLVRIFHPGTPNITLPANSQSYSQPLGAGQGFPFGVAARDRFGSSEMVVDEGSTSVLPATSVNASDTYSNHVVLTWVDRSTHESGYQIWRDQIVDGLNTGAILLTTTSANSTSHTDSTANSDILYEYCVSISGDTQMVCDTGKRMGSDTPPIIDPTLTAPGGINASDGFFQDRIQIEWIDTNAGEEGYTVYRRNSDGDLQNIGSTSPNATSFNDQSAGAGDAYEYCVRAFKTNAQNANTESAESCETGWRKANGVISGRVATIEGGGTDLVEVSVTPPGNNALLLDGSGGRVAIPRNEAFNFDTADDFTVEVWLNYIGSAGTGADEPDIIEFWEETASPYPFVLRGESRANPGRLLFGRYDGTIGVAVASSQSNLNDGTWHHVALVHEGTTRRMSIYIDGVLSGTNTYQTLGSTRSTLNTLYFGTRGGSVDNWFGGRMDEVRIWNIARTGADIRSTMHVPLKGDDVHLVGYWPLDQNARLVAPDISGKGANGNLIGGAHWSDQAAPLKVNAITDVAGNYSIEGLRYNGEQLFTVTPKLGTRSFTPPFKTITLATENPVQNEVNFADDSNFTLSGQVLFTGSSCPVPDVQFMVLDADSGEDPVLKGQSESDGTFAIAIDPSDPSKRSTDLRRLIPGLGDANDPHLFVLDGVIPAQNHFEYFAEKDSSGILFSDNKTRKLTGFFGGSGPSCSKDIGPATLKIFTENGCFSQEVPLTLGSFSLDLPPQKYLAQVEINPATIKSGLNQADVINFYENLGTFEIDLTDQADTLDLAYKAPLLITINGLGSNACSTGITVDGTSRALPGAALLNQNDSYNLTILVNEDYGSSGTCPLNGGTLAIFDDVGSVQDSVRNIVNGVVQYSTIAREPDVFAGRVIDGMDRSFQKSITVVADVDGRAPVSKTEWAVIDGSAPRIGTFVTAPSSPIPLWVLHDPPGDNSRSYIEKGSTLCFSWEFENAWVFGVEAGVQTKVGFSALTGTAFGGLFAVETEAIGGVTATFAAGGGPTATGSEALCMTTEEEISTSSNPVYTGKPADVFIGVGINFLFAEADRISVDNACTLTRSEELAGAIKKENPVDRTYHYTRAYIENILLPQTENLINNLKGTTASCAEADNIAQCNELKSGYDTWKNITAIDNTSRTIEKYENLAFEAGATINKSYTFDQTADRGFGAKGFITTSLEKSFKNDFFGSGVLVSLEGNFNFEGENIFNRERGESWKIGYELADDDGGDYFSVDVGREKIDKSLYCNVGVGVDFGEESFETGGRNKEGHPWCKDEKDLPRVPTDSLGTNRSVYLPIGEMVFKVQSGRSSNPWESSWVDSQNKPLLQPRDRAKIQVNPPIQSGIAPNDKASFTLSLTNAGDSQETREYVLRTVNVANPGGAEIKVNGTSLASGHSYYIGPQQTQEVTMTVERGPNRYDYKDLAVQLYPAGEYPIWEDGGYGGNGVIQQVDTVRFSVNFAAPCSPINLQFPKENWAFNASSTNLNYLLSGFNMISAPGDTVQAIGIQYRLANGLNQGGSTDGWVTLRHSLGELAITDKSKTGVWVPLGSDGAYELRAFTECGTSATKRFVYSDPVPGLVDRKTPGVLGSPEPADGVLALGDDIEIVFDERIDCTSIDTDALGSKANLQLSYVDGPNATMPISGIQTACNGEKIVIRPPDNLLSNIEGLQLEALLYNGGTDTGSTEPVVIKDLAGNPLPEQSWTFTVRQNAVAWQRGSLATGVQTSTNQIITATLVNGSPLPIQFSLPESFTLMNGSTAATVTPLITSGEIASEQAKSIGFTFPATATDGIYKGSVNATTSDGPLTLHFSVTVGATAAGAPIWFVDASAFQYSMSVLGTLQFAGTAANDAADQVAAFVGNEVRGLATVDPTNGRFFMTVYGHQPGETVSFQAYDASDSTLYQSSNQVLTFADQGTHGTPASPLEVNASLTPQGMQSIPLAQGWTWFSVNRDAPNKGIDAVLGAIQATDGDLIKDGSNTNFYLASATQQTWSQMGSISMIEPGSAYQIKLAQPSSLIISGNATPLAPIALQAGWSWLGFTSQTALPVGTALGSLTPSAGDLIKSQTQFAQYNGTNWIGSLATMEPGKGYQISLTSSGSLTYPPGSSAGNAALSSSIQISGPGKTNEGIKTEAKQPDIVPVDVFSFNPAAFAHSMTLSAEVILDGEVLQDEKVLVWASGKEDGKIRGVAQVQQVGELYRLFLMLHSDVAEGEPLTLSIYDPASDQIFDLDSALLFDAQAHHGSMDKPLAFEAMTEAYREALAAAALPKEFALAQNYPNPFNPQTTIHYELPEAVQVRLVVYDMLGREVMTLVDKEQQAGRYDVNFDASRLASGMYLYRIHAGEFTQVQKMVLAK